MQNTYFYIFISLNGPRNAVLLISDWWLKFPCYLNFSHIILLFIVNKITVDVETHKHGERFRRDISIIPRKTLPREMKLRVCLQAASGGLKDIITI